MVLESRLELFLKSCFVECSVLGFGSFLRLGFKICIVVGRRTWAQIPPGRLWSVCPTTGSNSWEGRAGQHATGVFTFPLCFISHGGVAPGGGVSILLPLMPSLVLFVLMIVCRFSHYCAGCCVLVF